MPSIEISQKDLCSLIGKKLTLSELEEAVSYAKAEVEAVEGDILKLDIKDTNRPDLWSAEGIAREIAGRVVKSKRATGLPEYKVNKSRVVVRVDRKVSKVRPLTVCAVVKGLNVTDDVLSQMIQLQEKVANSFGKNRREVAIGVYDLHKIKPPIRYTTVKPDGIRFVPLEFDKALTPREILQLHPKGKEFGHLLAGQDEYPIFIDSADNVLSLPPIINSNYTGKVTHETKDLFIECSGFDFKFLLPALNVIVTALAERGAKIQSVKIVYPDKTMHTPDLTPKQAVVDVAYVNKLSGLNLTAKQMCRLLEQARYEAKLRNGRIKVWYPAYRQDIIHQRDIVEDIIVSYGYNRIEPEEPKLATVGAISEVERFSNKVAEIMIGLGMQEVLSYMMTNKENLFAKMNLSEQSIAEVENPVSANWCVFRNWLLPGLLEFLSHNLHVEYPQRVFEIGDVVLLDEKTETKTKNIRKLAAAISESKVSYENIASVVDALLTNLGVSYALKPTKHPSFIDGRVAAVVIDGKDVGIIGEIHPLVLSNFGIEMPVVAFEIDIEAIFLSHPTDQTL